MVKTKVRDITWNVWVGFYHCSVVPLPFQLLTIICPNGLLIASSKASSYLFSSTRTCDRPGVNRSVQIFCSPWFWDMFTLNLVYHPREKIPCPTMKKWRHTKFFCWLLKMCYTRRSLLIFTQKTVIKMLANSRKRNTPVLSKPTQLDIKPDDSFVQT